jgi:hypothetical protein
MVMPSLPLLMARSNDFFAHVAQAATLEVDVKDRGPVLSVHPGTVRNSDLLAISTDRRVASLGDDRPAPAPLTAGAKL